MKITAKKEDEPKLIAILQAADAEEFDKDVACRQLAVVGTGKAVPALAALLEDDHLYDVARHALTQIPDPAAGAALRDALGKVKGRRLVAVINSIGNRQDREAVEALAARLSDADKLVAAEAAASLAKIGGRQAGGALSRALTDAPAGNRPAVADACVTLAERLIERDMHRVAARMFDRVREADLPKHIRIAATRGAVLARQDEGAALVVELLTGEDYGMFELGLKMVRELEGSQPAGAVAAQVGKLPAQKRVLLLHALGDRRDPAALEVVLGAAKGGESDVRIAALQAAGQIGDESAMAVLKKAADDSDARVADAARKSLAAFALKKPE